MSENSSQTPRSVLPYATPGKGIKRRRPILGLLLILVTLSVGFIGAFMLCAGFMGITQIVTSGYHYHWLRAPSEMLGCLAAGAIVFFFAVRWCMAVPAILTGRRR